MVGSDWEVVYFDLRMDICVYLDERSRGGGL